MIYLLLTCWFLSMIFLFLNHPLSLGSILLLQTIISSLITGKFYYNYWFSYILFLIMIGGMLILFMYMTSVASNEKFKYSNFLMFLSLILIFMTFFILLLDNFPFLENKLNFNMMNKIFKNPNLSMNKLLNFPNNLIFILLMIYLLITMIAVVKITKKNFGPLRQKF
uniref:NADH dehydrogenase subunit 6 n=1 Tax=Lissorhoptrus oryzophilus TaxID=308863 RepID=UPI001BEFE56F|nr:NADH dehydrogenase subunit 6 [Lissorhoptrus oryzophilus]QUA05799.1 NADH dehydrogenase subunit 6 [Lissorhoptrus oryzophilus]